MASIFDNVTVDEIKAVRERTGYGLVASRRLLKDSAALAAVDEMQKEGSIDYRLAEVLAYLIRRG